LCIGEEEKHGSGIICQGGTIEQQRERNDHTGGGRKVDSCTVECGEKQEKKKKKRLSAIEDTKNQMKKKISGTPKDWPFRRHGWERKKMINRVKIAGRTLGGGHKERNFR